VRSRLQLQRCGNFKMEAQTIIIELSRRPKLSQLEVNECELLRRARGAGNITRGNA